MYLLESPRRGDSYRYYDFVLNNNTGLPIKNTQNADFCADRIDIITNFAAITNVVIISFHCNYLCDTGYFL